MTTPCVCGHQPADHHAHTGHCHDCTCSYYEPDTGNDYTRTITPNYGGPYLKYTGQYAQHYTLDEEPAHRMNVCKHSVTRLETEQQRNPHWETVTHYAHALGVRLENVPEDAPVSPKSVVPLVECVDEAAREEQG